MSGLLSLKFALLRALGRHVPIRGRDRLLRLLENPDSQRDFPFVEDFQGFRYPGNLKRFIDWSVYFYGGYSGHELTLLGDLARGLRSDGARGVVAWDIGANIGHHCLYMAGIADQVIAFEPIPFNADLLQEKLMVNALGTVELHRLALGDEPAELPLHHPDMANSPNVGTASFYADYNPANNVDQTTAQVVVGDDYREELGLPAPDLIKIDVEGFERPALAGMAKTLRGNPSAVLVEMSDYTWKSFANLDELRMILPDREFFELHATPDPMGYRAGPLQFGVSPEIFAISRSRPTLVAAFAGARDGLISRPTL